MHLRNARFYPIVFAVAQAACQQTMPSPSAPEPTSLQRIELGVAYNNLGLNTCYRTPGCAPLPPHNSFGPSLTINLNEHWAVDASYDLTTGYKPLEYESYSDGSVAGGRGSKALIGGRYNLRASRYSLFVYGTTGALIWSGVPSQDLVAPGTILPYELIYGEQAYFAVGAGGGVEYSPSARVHVRASVGDLVVDYRRDRFSGCSPCSDGKGTAWNHNSDAVIGVYAGLGKSLPGSVPILSTEPTHRFWDKKNLAFIGVDLLAQSADAAGTQHFIRYGFVEQDGLARPLVDKGWPGQITLGAIGSGAGLLAMYALHRMGHHRLERLLPLAAAVPSAYLGYNNLRDWGLYENH